MGRLLPQLGIDVSDIGELPEIPELVQYRRSIENHAEEMAIVIETALIELLDRNRLPHTGEGIDVLGYYVELTHNHEADGTITRKAVLYKKVDSVTINL